MHLFCLHHAGGTSASFAKWRFTNVAVTKLGYRGRDFASIPHAAAVLSESVKASPSPRLALYGHSMGAALAYEIALRVQGSGRLQHVFLAAARPPVPGRQPVSPDGVVAATTPPAPPGQSSAPVHGPDQREPAQLAVLLRVEQRVLHAHRDQLSRLRMAHRVHERAAAAGRLGPAPPRTQEQMNESDENRPAEHE